MDVLWVGSWLTSPYAPTPQSSTPGVIKYCDPIYPHWLWFIQKGNIKNTYINIRFWMNITWISYVFIWGLWGKNKASDFYELNLTSLDRDCQIASCSVIFWAWVIGLTTSALKFAHVDTAKAAGDNRNCRGGKKPASLLSQIIIICVVVYRL